MSPDDLKISWGRPNELGLWPEPVTWWPYCIMSSDQTDRATEDKEPNKYGRSLGARVEGGGHDQRDTADVSGDAGVGSSGMGGLASLELGDPGSSRNRKYTEKGFEYKCDLQKRDFSGLFRVGPRQLRRLSEGCMMLTQCTLKVFVMI